MNNVDTVSEILLYDLSDADLIRCSVFDTLRSRSALQVLTRRSRQRGYYVRLYNTNSLNIILNHHPLVVHLDLTEFTVTNSLQPIRQHRPERYVDFWNNFSESINRLRHLRIIQLRFCTSTVLQNLSISNPLLQKIRSIDTIGTSMNMFYLKRLRYLQEVHIQFDHTKYVSLGSDLSTNDNLDVINLALTGVRHFLHADIRNLVNVNHLRYLSLGSVPSLSWQFLCVLINLNQLEKLRLEGLRTDSVLLTFEAAAVMKYLRHLELIDIDTPYGVEEAISKCTNLVKLLIAPNPQSSSMFSNRMILCGVARLGQNLRNFEWVFTRYEYSTNIPNTIKISEYLPHKNEDGSIYIPDTYSNLNQIFNLLSLRSYIQWLIPYCIVSIRETTYENSFSSEL